MSIRLGLCCIFAEAPIKFGATTVTHIMKLERAQALEKISKLCLNNAKALSQALFFCREKGIGCFRVASHILPVKTHRDAGYEIEDLPDHQEILETFKQCGDFAKTNDIRTCFHPDQFVVLNSPNPEIVRKSIVEIEYQAKVASWINADVVNIHAGGDIKTKQKH